MPNRLVRRRSDLYRAMKADDEGYPVVEPTARGLGVRVGKGQDISVQEGLVGPRTGGVDPDLDGHAFLEPSRRMPIHTYAEAIASDQRRWRVILKP